MRRHRANGALLSLLIFTLFACQQYSARLSGDLPVNVPDAITAGDSLTVTVGPVQVLDGTRIGLVMVGKRGPRIYSGEFEEGVAEFLIPGEDTLQHGYLAFIAASQEARGEAGLVLLPRLRPGRSSASARETIPTMIILPDDAEIHRASAPTQHFVVG